VDYCLFQATIYHLAGESKLTKNQAGHVTSTELLICMLSQSLVNNKMEY
jgi:hypothetical protein